MTRRPTSWRGRHLLAAALLACGAGLAAPAQAQPAPVEVRVHLVALRNPTVAAEIPGRVIAMAYRPGEAFARDAVLLAFDCSLHRAREARAQALRDRAARQAASSQSLDRSGATSRLEVGLALADLAGAEAELKLAQLTVQRCEIRAPFPGRVVERRVQPGEYVTEGQPVLEVIDESELELEAIVPSHLLVSLREGSAFDTALDEAPGTVRARVVRIAPLIDPVSQTVKIYARLEPSEARLMAGMSGVARFAPAPGGR